MTNRFSRRVGVLAVVTLLVGSSVFAQGGPFGATSNIFTQMNEKLDQILAVLSPAAAGPVTLRTGALIMGFDAGDALFCFVTNVGSNPLVVSIKILNSANRVIRATEPEHDINSGLTTALSVSATQFPFQSALRCEFSFVGFAKDVRANAQLSQDLSGTNVTTAVLEAR